MHRMQRKDSRGEPRTRHLQLAKHQPKQHGIGPMKQNVYEVVAARGEFPCLVFDPEAGKRERVVLWRSAGLKPDSTKAIRRPQRGVVLNVVVVVPDETAMLDDGKIGDTCEEDQRRGEDLLVM